MIPLRGQGSAQPGQRTRQRAPMVASTFVIRMGDEGRKANALRALETWTASGDVEVTLAPYRPKRSHAQHNLFWSWCEYVAAYLRDAGQPCCDESVHDEVLGEIYGWEERGFGRRRPRKTLTRPYQMGKVEMMEVLTRFEVWASELGCMVPRPATWDADIEEARKEKQRRAA